MEIHEFTVSVRGCTAEQAQQVMAERIGPDEDYGFDYRIDWADAPARPEPISQPLTLAELRAGGDDVTANVGVNLDDLLNGDLDVLNDRVSEAITGSIVGLLDISYKVVGSCEGEVVLQVSGTVDLDALEDVED